jgi:hypothetical protein
MRLEAEHEIEMTIGNDHVMRLNVDGMCLIRVSVARGCVLRIRNDSADIPVNLSPLTPHDLSRPSQRSQSREPAP